MIRVGLVSPSTDAGWLGGVYITQNLALAATLYDEPDAPSFRDVWWRTAPAADPWSEIRPHLGHPAVVNFPSTLPGRVARAWRRKRSGARGLRDLFNAAGVDVLFPVSPVEDAGVPFVFHLPDFQQHYLPDVNDEAVRTSFDAHFRKQAGAAAIVHLSSESVLEDMRRFMPDLVPKTRVVFPVSVPSPLWYERDPARVARSLQLPERYVVIPNQVSAHKNHATIAQAIALLRDRGVDAHVVCTGRTADYRDPDFFTRLTAGIARLGIADRFRFLGILDRRDQFAVIRRAVALVQPSRFEGWGAAVAEGKSLGKRILASDLAVNHEHQPDDVQWIEPLSVEGWADAIAGALAHRAPGPDLNAEDAARTRVLAEARNVGRGFSAVLAEAASAR
jgi:glycosyltransferase involved in cell wall biosynthesis